MQSLLVEFAGTFFLMFAVIFSGEPWAIGLMLTAMVYCGERISGAYYNPAITSAAWWAGKLTSVQLIHYSITQIAGAFAAALYFWWASGDYFILELPAGVLSFDIGCKEVLLTMALSLVVLSVTNTPYSSSMIGGLVSGVSLAALMTIGGLYNPAIFLGAALCNLLGGYTPNYYNIFTFVVGPLIGGCVAAHFFDYLHKKLPNQ